MRTAMVLVLAFLAVLPACSRGKETTVASGATPIADQHSELIERADRGRIRPLQPPAAPDTRRPQAARPAPQRTVRPPARPVQAAPAGGDRWARLRECESGGNYAENTGNGYYGAYQADRGTWGGYGGYPVASAAPPAVQDAWALALYARRGAQPWPRCGRYL